LVTELGRHILCVSGDQRSAGILRHRIDIAIKRGIAASILGIMIPRHLGIDVILNLKRLTV